MRILIAPDKFKGSLSAGEAAEAIRRGVARAWPEAVCRLLPIADGGEGTAAAVHAALGGEWVTRPARDPLGRTVEARYLWVPEHRLALVEMSAASGLWRLEPEERNPLKATTFGTGELLRDAVAVRGARKVIVGLGGSATNDGGIGMAAAFGFRFLTSDGEPLDARPENLLALTAVQPPVERLHAEVIAACDVRNPLLGPRGASSVFGPQKGADPRTVGILEASLENLADVVAKDLGHDFRDVPGAGAAGGIGFGLLSFCGATIRSGFGLIAETLDLERAVAASDFVFTGEGSLDAQTLDGKGPAGVAALARKHGKPVVAFAGVVADEPEIDAAFDAALPITNRPMTLLEAVRDAAALLESSAARAVRLIRL